MSTKPPFYIVDEFISPLQCEDIILQLNNTFPDRDKSEVPLKFTKFSKLLDIRLFPLLDRLIPTLEEYYGFGYKGTLPFSYEWFPEGFMFDPPRCENSAIIEGKWKKVRENDFTGIIFLNSFNMESDFDPEYESYGGRLEFPTHGFSFNPERGKLIIFPSGPNFINATEKVFAGELNQIRIHIASEQTFVYNPRSFQGNYKTWF
jgi:hypothetical protein